jgi:predicted ATPase/transcriptional regulator with XRE-family HTH domain
MDELGPFGSWLKRRRRELDLTQAELAQRVGCSEAAIRKIEAEERKPSQQLAGLLAKELHIPEAEQKAFIRFARRVLPDAGWLSGVSAPVENSLAHRLLTPSNNLPSFLTSLVDRTQDIAAVLELITGGQARLVTLVGPPGIGKTRLSIHAAQQALPHFRDGAWFVDLSALRQADFVLSAIGRALSRFDLPQSPTLEQLTIGLKDTELLLVLDNFEQVEDAAGDVAALLKGCPRIKTLVSSRVPLNVYGEYKYEVPALSVPPLDSDRVPGTLMQFEAVQLFVARAGQFQTGFRITGENAQAVVEICTRMDGLPLALELAAASLHQMSLERLVEILHPDNETNWLRQISHPARDLPPRQQTLENVIAWSFTLLSPDRQRFFSRLGIFTGRFEVGAAAAVCGEAGLDLTGARAELEYLTDHSLLQQSRADGRVCWHMLETIHEFALLRAAPAEQPAIRSKHARYYHSLLENLSRDPSMGDLELFFQINGGNLHQALRWAVSDGEKELALSLAVRLCDVWEHVGYLREGLDLIQQVLSMPGKVGSSLLIRFLNKASTLAWQQHRFDFALSLSDEALGLAKSDHLDDDYIMLLNLQGRIFIEQGRYREAQAVLSECRDLALVRPSVFNPGVPLVQLGEIELALGNYGEAQSGLQAALRYLEDRSDIFWLLGVTDLAEVALATRDYGEARRRLQQAKDTAGRHVRRLLCYLSSVAGYLVLTRAGDRPSLQRAVEIYAAIQSIQEHSGEALVPFYVELNASRIALTRLRLEKSKLESAWATGRDWPRQEILGRAVEGVFSA